MKSVKIFLLACGLLLSLACSLRVESHQSGQDHITVEHFKTKEEHQQNEALIALFSDAAKQLVKDPKKAAQIPTMFIKGTLNEMNFMFDGVQGISDRTRSLQLTFVNLSGKDVVLEEPYFDSGEWYTPWPPIIKGGMNCQGSVASKDASIFTGVTGGLKLKIQGTIIYIYLGFNNPYIGSYKNYGQLSLRSYPAKYGYDHSENNSPKTSILAGFQLKVVQAASSYAQMAMVYTLSPA